MMKWLKRAWCWWNGHRPVYDESDAARYLKGEISIEEIRWYCLSCGKDMTND